MFIFLPWKRSHSSVLLSIHVLISRSNTFCPSSCLPTSRRWFMPGRNKLFGSGTSLVFIVTACLPLCAAVSNDSVFTIDDASGSAQFHTSPITTTSIPFNSTDSTNPQWTHQNCSSCLEKLDLTAVNGGTYTAVYLPPGNTFQYNISFEFNGNAVYVYFILSKQAATSCKFILDGEATPYTGVSVDAFQYQTLVFSSGGLSLQAHTLTITAEGEPNKANYVNFDFANFTRPSHTTLASPSTSTNETDPNAPMPSSPPQNNHTTLKAIIGGVVGGFIAVVLLIVVATFYRSRRLREIEETAHPLIQTSNRNKSRVNASRSAPNEQRHLMPYTHPALHSSHHERGKSSLTALGLTPFDLSRSAHHNRQPITDLENRDQRRGERRLELNNRLEAVTTQMRFLKTSYAQDQTRLQDALHRQRQQTQRQDIYFEPNGNTVNSSNSDSPPVAGGVPRPIGSTTAGGIRQRDFPLSSHPSALVPIRMPEPFIPEGEDGSLGEPMVNPHVLADMRAQMGIMMDQIQYLRAQQNTPTYRG